MKKIFPFIFALILFCSCAGVRTVYDTERIVTVENIQLNTMNHKSKYIVKAWSYYPTIKQYRIYTDTLYPIGQKISIKGK